MQRGAHRFLRAVVQRQHEAVIGFGQQFGSRRGQGISVRHARGQRRDLQQAREPAMERIDRQRLRTRQDAVVQAAGKWQLVPKVGGGNTPFEQQRGDLSVRRQRQRMQQRQQPFLHFLRCLAGKGNCQQGRRLAAGQQQTQHAGHQQPGFAAAGAGFDHDRRLRRASRGNESRGVDCHAVNCVGPRCRRPDLVSYRRRHALASCRFQRGYQGRHAHQAPLRHRPRTAQYWHTVSIPEAGNGAPSDIASMLPVI